MVLNSNFFIILFFKIRPDMILGQHDSNLLLKNIKVQLIYFTPYRAYDWGFPNHHLLLQFSRYTFLPLIGTF